MRWLSELPTRIAGCCPEQCWLVSMLAQPVRGQMVQLLNLLPRQTRRTRLTTSILFFSCLLSLRWLENIHGLSGTVQVPHVVIEYGEQPLFSSMQLTVACWLMNIL